MQKHGNKYGTHRVIEPKGVLPQPANKLDESRCLLRRVRGSCGGGLTWKDPRQCRLRPGRAGAGT